MNEAVLDNRPLGEGTVEMQPLSATTGIEIVGVDLREPLPEPTFLEIRRALGEWGVIFFRDQDLTPDQQIAFARRFGVVEERKHPSTLGAMDGYPELSEISRAPTAGRNVGGFWHTDQCFLPDPPLGSVLLARTVPACGGDTMFAHMGAACDRLSEELKAMLRGMRAVHVRLNGYATDGKLAPGVSQEEYDAFQEKYAGVEATHPVIGRHPETGREILYVNHAYTDRFEGWTRAESQPLIQYLCELATQPENVCRFRWEEGSLAFWENRSVVHYALDDYPGQDRVMNRCVVRGAWLEAC